MYEHILQISVISLILYFSRQYTSILLMSGGIDTIFISFNFIRHLLISQSDKNLILSQFITNVNQLYSLNILNRYIYYIILEIIYRILCVMLWSYSVKPVYIILMLSVCPIILNYISKKVFKSLFRFIEKEKKRFIETIICKQLALIINFVSTICIDNNPRIVSAELLPLFENYDESTDNIIEFTKGIVIMSLVHYARNNTTTFYKNMIYYIYNYQTGELLESINEADAKNKFRKVVSSREWDKLFKTEILQSIVKIYGSQNSQSMLFINEYIKIFHYTFLKISCMWTLSRWFNLTYISPILSLIFYIYGFGTNKVDRIYQYLFRFIAFVLCVKTDYYLLISVISEIGSILLVNKLTFSVITYLKEKIIYMGRVLFHYQGYNVFLISIYIYVKISDYEDIYYYILNGIFMIVCSSDNFK